MTSNVWELLKDGIVLQSVVLADDDTDITLMEWLDSFKDRHDFSQVGYQFRHRDVDIITGNSISTFTYNIQTSPDGSFLLEIVE